MQWWGWALVWIALVALAIAYLGWRCWRLWPPLKALGVEAAQAQDRLAAVEAQIEALQEQLEDVDDLAVWQSPARLRQEYADQRARRRAERAKKRAAHRPAWADHVEW